MTLGIEGIGGGGQTAGNWTAYILGLAGVPSNAAFLYMDALRDDPRTRVGADSYARRVDAAAGEFLHLATDHARHLLTEISDGSPLAGFEFVDRQTAGELLRVIPSPDTGSGQEPLISALSAHANPGELRRTTARFVERARAQAQGGEPLLFVAFGLAGGVGVGAARAAVTEIRYQAPKATIGLVVMLPAPWRRFAEREQHDHMDAKAIAALRAIEAGLWGRIDVTFVLGAGNGEFPGASPADGVCAVAGEYMALCALSTAAHRASLANVGQALRPEAPLSTLGVGVIRLAELEQANRLARARAVRGYRAMLELSPDDRMRIEHDGDDVVATFRPCRHAGEIVATPEEQITELADPDQHPKLLGIGATRNRPLPRLSEDGAREVGASGVTRPTAGEVRAHVERLIRDDERAVRDHLEANAIEGTQDFARHVETHLQRHFPPTGVALGEDPPRLARERGVLRDAEGVYERAARLLQADSAQIEHDRQPLKTAEDRLEELLGPDPRRRVSKRRALQCLAAARAVIVARRWQLGVAAATSLFRELATGCEKQADRLSEVLEVIRDLRDLEAREHASAVERLTALAKLPHQQLAVAPGSGSERRLDRLVLRRIRGDEPDVELRALKQMELVRSAGDDGAVSEFTLRYPGPPGTPDPISAPLGSERDAELGRVPGNVLSDVILTDAGGWKGAATTYRELPLWDALGVDVAERGDRLERRVEDVVDEYATTRVSWLQLAAQPLADARPLSDVDPKVPGLTEILTLDGRAPITIEGKAVQEAFTRALQALNRSRERADDETQLVEVGGATMALVWQRHGLRLAQLVEAHDAVDAYLACDRPIHTLPQAVVAREIERVARRQGQLRPGRLLGGGILRLLVDPDLLRWLAVLIATHNFPTSAGAGFGEPAQFELEWRVNGVLRREVIGPANDAAGAMVECMRRADELRVPIVWRAKAVWEDLVHSLRLEGALRELDAAVERLDLGPGRRDLDPEQLRVALRILLSSDGPRGGGTDDIVVVVDKPPPSNGGGPDGKHRDDVAIPTEA